MYDTIELELPFERAGVSNLLTHLKSHLPKYKEKILKIEGFEYESIESIVGSNYKLYATHNKLSLKGSLAKYYLDDNIHALTRADSKRALEKMTDELHLPLLNALVRRIDVAQNLIMKHPPIAYHKLLGECKSFERYTRSESLYYENGLRTLLLYDKLSERLEKGYSIPPVFVNQNVLRYELRFTSRLAKAFNLPELTASLLYDERFYFQVVERWVKEYESIDKLNYITMNFSAISSPKDVRNQLALMQLKQLGPDGISQLLKELKANKAFAKPEYYSRLKREILHLCNSQEQSYSSELIGELDKKVKAAKMLCR